MDVIKTKKNLKKRINIKLLKIIKVVNLRLHDGFDLLSSITSRDINILGLTNNIKKNIIIPVGPLIVSFVLFYTDSN